MAKGISLFPQLNDSILSKVRFDSGEYEFFYSKDGEENELTYETVDGSDSIYKLADKLSVWDVDNYNLGIRKSIECRSCANLFGSDGVACNGATIGIAMMWMSAESRQRGTIELGEIKNSLEPQSVDCVHLFKKGQLRGRVIYDIVLYIKEPARDVEDNEKQLANETGYLLGAIGDAITIQLDGAGSAFPIYEESRPDGPLWRVECDWDDPSDELFEESVKIVINKAHSSYKYIDKNDKFYVPQMLREIMSSALTVILTTFKADENAWYTLEDEDNITNGSLAQAVLYFRNTHNWDLDSVETISLSIREFFEREM